jgi:hydroxypyruvate isomerase
MSEPAGFVANCSLLFREHELLERPAAARAAGFEAVEFWWPFSEPVPSDRDVDAFIAAIEDAGVQLVALNFYAGDLAGPDCGVLSLPGRVAEFVAGLEVAAAIGERLDVRLFNALYGVRDDTITTAEQDELAESSLSLAAATVGAFGGTVLVEAVSGPKPYCLRSAADAVAVVDRVRARGIGNIGFLCDLFHLAANGDDLEDVIARHADTIAHVQIADQPGRHEPGTGTIDFEACFDALARTGYDGWIGLEYLSTTTTTRSFGWLPDTAGSTIGRGRVRSRP